MTSASLPVVRLKKSADRRLRSGHRWIYSNEIDNDFCALKTLDMGSCASVQDANGKSLGSACFSYQSLLCGRIFSNERDVDFSAVVMQRLKAALAWRERIFAVPCYRLVYGDGDGLPGVVVDRYGNLLVLQLTTAGAMKVIDVLVEALVELLKPAGILLKSDSANPTEQLAAETRILYGSVPEEAQLEESGLDFVFPLQAGQKTGWFYDHRDSRSRLKEFVSGARVLDLFGYLGAWGLQTLAGGAASVHLVDRSVLAVDYVRRNAELQGVSNKVTVTQSSVDDALKSMIADGEQYDVVIVDPPAFIKKRKDQSRGEQAYHRLNQQAARLLTDNGLLVSASCSLHLAESSLQSIVRIAADKRQRQASVVYRGGLGADHPMLAAIPEMNYLKTLFARISSAG